MPNLAMRSPATQFSADDLELSWPLGGEREVVAVPEEKLTLRIKRRIAEGHIVITDDKPTKKAAEARVYRLLTGEEARKKMAEPAGPVTRVVYHPATPKDEQDYQLEVQTAQMDSDTFLAAQEERARAAEEAHAAIVERQVEAEKAAAEAAASAEAEDEGDDPLAESRRRTEEANAESAAAYDEAFMEREKERQSLEDDEMKSSEKAAAAAAKEAAESEPDTSDEDKAFMEQEKARQKAEEALEKERAKAAKAAAKVDAETEKTSIGYAGKTDPVVEISSVGRRVGATITPADKALKPAATKKSTKKAAASKDTATEAE